MIATGQIIEVGQLVAEDGALGFVIQRPNGEFITVKGLTLEETRAAAAMFLQPIGMAIQPAAGVPP